MARNPANAALYPPRPARDLCGNWLTLENARDMGLTETGEKTRQAGYCTRRGDREKSIVFIAGKGKRAGQLYDLAPCFDTTRYCYRVWLKKAGGEE